MLDLLKNQLPKYYGLHRTVKFIFSEKTNKSHFDLDDGHNTIIVNYQSGNVSFEHSTKTNIEVIDYEKYINGFSGTVFEKGRLRCDFILYDLEGLNFFLLNEQTSTTGSTANLAKPIIGRNGIIRYAGGKYEKAADQLLETVKTLKDVPIINNFIGSFIRKVCLMSYVINRTSLHPAVDAFVNRYKQVESKETGDNGAILCCPKIEAKGFEFRRISHNYTFKLD